MMFAKVEALAPLTRLAYSGLEVSLVLALLEAAASLMLRLATTLQRRGNIGTQRGDQPIPR